jgi:DNA-binding HxlR family transcriptional regulator
VPQELLYSAADLLKYRWSLETLQALHRRPHRFTELVVALSRQGRTAHPKTVARTLYLLRGWGLVYRTYRRPTALDREPVYTITLLGKGLLHTLQPVDEYVRRQRRQFIPHDEDTD